MRRSLALALAALAAPGLLRAQQPDAWRERLSGRLDAASRPAIEALVDSAVREGLPATPFVDKALEGASKQADGPRILAVLRTLRGNLTSARAALGPGTSEPALVAGAAALRRGVAPARLGEIAADRRGEDLAVALVVLGDLVASGVPTDTAAAVVAALSKAHAADDDFLQLRRQVGRDVGAGVAPGAAAWVRARGFLPGGQGNAGGMGGGPPGGSPPGKARGGPGSGKTGGAGRP